MRFATLSSSRRCRRVSLFNRTGALSVEIRLPGFDGATRWLNSPPLTKDGLRGKVVPVDFWAIRSPRC